MTNQNCRFWEVISKRTFTDEANDAINKLAQAESKKAYEVFCMHHGPSMKDVIIERLGELGYSEDNYILWIKTFMQRHVNVSKTFAEKYVYEALVKLAACRNFFDYENWSKEYNLFCPISQCREYKFKKF